MLLVQFALGGALVGTWVYCVLDVARSEPDRVRGLPKGQWLLAVVLLNFLGCLLWLRYGRPRGGTDAGAPAPQRRRRPAPGQGPEDDPEFLEWLRQQGPR